MTASGVVRTEPRNQDPRLVLRFTMFTAAALAVSSVAMVVVVRGFVDAIRRSRVWSGTRACRRRASSFPGSFVAGGLRGARDPVRDGKSSIGSSARHVLVDGVERASLFTRTGVVSYSTDPALIGWRTRDSGEARQALRSGTIETLVESETARRA